MSNDTIEGDIDPYWSQLMLEFQLTTVGTGEGINIENLDFAIKKIK
jgi:hypothetical protein